MYKSYNDYREDWKNAAKQTPKIPLNVDVELSAVCNLECPFCFLQNKKYQKPEPAFMPTEVAVEVINEAAKLGVPALKFNWRGEPTLHPQFNEILMYASKKNFWDIIVNTNGNFRYSKLAGLSVATKVIFSIDTFDFDLYKQMRKGGDLAKVLLNVNFLFYNKHKNIVLRRIITEENKNEDFKGIAKKLITDVKVSEHYAFERVENKKMNIPRTYCEYPSQRLVVATNGNVYPCCIDYFETMKLGNIKSDKLIDIWNSKKLVDLRSELKKGNFQGVCANCTSWLSYDEKIKREAVKT